MIRAWRAPVRIEAHRLIREDNLFPYSAEAVQRDSLPSRTVEEVFYAGLLKDVILGSPNETNTRIDTFFDGFRGLPLFDHPLDLPTWGDFGAKANNRRPVEQAILGQTLQMGREFLASTPGRFLVRVLPFENRERRNKTHEVLYFRDSGIHRRLIERTVNGSKQSHSEAVEKIRKSYLEDFVPKRWEAFVINSIIDLVGERCNSFAYRHEETREIDLILEWHDRTPTERWAIEVCSRKYNRHPSGYFSEECRYLGVEATNRFLVWRTDNCDGGVRGRGGIPAVSLMRMIGCLRDRMRR